MLDAENTAEAAETSASDPITTEPPTAHAATPSTDTPEGGQADDAAARADDPAAEGAAPAKKAPTRRATAKKAPAKKATTRKTAAKRTAKKAAGPEPSEPVGEETAGATLPAAASDVTSETPDRATDETPAGGEQPGEAAEAASAAKRPAKKTAKKTAAKRTTKKASTAQPAEGVQPAEPTLPTDAEETGEQPEAEETAAPAGPPPATALLFQPPDVTKAVTRRRRSAKSAESAEQREAEVAEPAAEDRGAGEPEPAKKPAKKTAKKTAKKSAKKTPEQIAEEPEEAAAAVGETGQEPGEQGREAGPAEGEEDQAGERRRRRRGGRRRRRSGGGEDGGAAETADQEQAGGGERAEQNGQAAQAEGEETEEPSAGSRRRRRRRRSGENGEGAAEEEGTVSRARRSRTAEDEITALSGSTRLEAKKQRRREGREAGRRRAPIVSEAEFLARRESVDRVMVIRQREDLTQIAVLEDKVLVEHYVARESQTSLIGNVYLGRVQNVLPSMEAAFIDIGKGRNAVLYAGEVNWDALGAKNGQPRKIEAVLKSGQSILVQVTKDPIGHKGARLTSQISLPGRFLVYVPDGTTSGISRKLPDTERNRLKALLKAIVPETAGVIVRTAAEGASEEELTRDVERLTARWADIESKVKNGNAPQLLYGEPDLTLKVVRDLFTEDFSRLVIAGADAWDMVEGYVTHVAPDLADRLEKYDGERDVFAAYRIDEQIEKALDRKVWLPSGGSLVIDRTEAMTVVDVNTGKFTGSGGNLEETVTKNNLEAAEEIVRQLRLRDIGGIIVVDFIDMVLESNRDLVLRRLVECLGRDRTRHQVAEVTSLGLVQMTRKRIGTGLLEAFSETCEHCQGRGLVLHHEPVEPKKKAEDESRRSRRGGRGRGREEAATASSGGNGGGVPSPKDIAAMAKPEERRGEQAEQGADGSPDAEARGDHPETAEVKAAEAQPAEAQPEPAASESVGQPAAQAEGSLEGSRVEAASEAGQPTTEERAPDEAAAPEPAAPVTPKIVTSVRRRSARRPAGPPAGATETQAVLPSPSVNGSGSSPDGQAGHAEDQATEEPADADPIASLVDDAELESGSTAQHDDNGEGHSGEETGAEVPSTPHVPVKRKGSRRR